MLKLKFQYFGHLMQTYYSLEKTLMLKKTEGRRSRGDKRMRWLDSIINSMYNLVCCSPWHCRVGHDLVSELNFRN